MRAIVLVDEDPEHLEALRALVAHASPRVRILAARHAHEAMPALREADLVVTDRLAVLRAARELRPDAARWLFTGRPLLELDHADLDAARPHGLVSKSEGVLGLSRALGALAEGQAAQA